jgi:hypothetical protein
VFANGHVDDGLLEAVGEVVELADVGVLLVKGEEGLNGFATSFLGL